MDGEDELGPEAVDAILEILQERDAVEREQYPDVSAFLSDFWEANSPDMIGSGKRAENAGPEGANVLRPAAIRGAADSTAPKRQRSRVKGVLRAAGIFAAALIVFSIASVSAYAAGFNIWGTVASWTAERFSFGGNIELLGIPMSPKYEGEYDSIQDALDAYGITAPLVPRWIPNGYSMEELEVKEWQDRTNFTAACYNDEEKLIVIAVVQHNISDPFFMIHEKDDSEVLVHTMGGIDHYILSNNGRLNVTWVNGCYECMINTDLTFDELIRMVDSIYGR